MFPGNNILHSDQKACRAAFVTLCLTVLLCSACEDRLPSSWNSDPVPADSLADNAFVLDGNGYKGGVFNLSPHSARAYYFSDDAMTSILNADNIIGPQGRPLSVVVHITVPGDESGSFPWANALVSPTAKSKIRISIDDEEYVSIRGATQIFMFSDISARRVRGSYSGIIENSSGKQLILSDGRFDGSFF